MIYVGIDVAKDKHDCIITNSDGEVLVSGFTITNNRTGLDDLYSKIIKCSKNKSEIKIGLEATGHYSNNLLEYLIDKDLPTFVINPLHTNLYRKSLSLRKTKTDTIDAYSIVTMLHTECLKSYTPVSYHISELKSLARYRFSLVQDCARQKSSYARLLNLLFPELQKLIPTIHLPSIYAMLEELPGATYVAECHLTHLSNILQTSSRSQYGREKANAIREAARASIGTNSLAKSLELKQTIQLIRSMQDQIKNIEGRIKPIVDSIDSPIMTIPGISYKIGSMIIAEIGDFSKFETAEKILAYAGLEPSIHQSGNLVSNHASMVKRGSKYLRYALFTAAKLISIHDPTFSAYLSKKRSEGKHYYVAVSHVAKKLVRVIYYLVKTNQIYHKAG